MDRKEQKMLKLREQALENEDYLTLMNEHSVRNVRFLEVMGTLPAEQQTAIFDYLGVVLEMQFKLLELALS